MSASVKLEDNFDLRKLIIRTVLLKEIYKVAELYGEEEGISVDSILLVKMKEAYKGILEKGDCILGAFDGDNLLGCLTVHFLVDTYPGYTDGPYMHIETIIVNRKHRNIGVGTALMKRVVGIGREVRATYIVVQTGKDNISARKMYEKCGFNNRYVNYVYTFS
ncbi:Acetyltransferase (GNAT) family protein [compost metagenome]